MTWLESEPPTSLSACGASNFGKMIADTRQP